MAFRIQRYIRPLEEVKKIMLERARSGRGPFDGVPFDLAVVERIFSSFDSLDRDGWADAFSAGARPFEERAREAESGGDFAKARENYRWAYAYYRMGRYPAPNSPRKRAAYERSRDCYLKFARHFDPPIEVVEMPFRARHGEGKSVVGYLRRPGGNPPFPVVVAWGGIDGFKEERGKRTDALSRHGLATIAIDMPGTGEAPIVGSEDAERMWDSVFDWIETQPDLDKERVGIVGASTGGYWAAKLAHTHRERIRAAVNHGGCSHYAFTQEWIEKSQHGEYPLELAETLAFAFGHSTFEEWVEYAPRLSLLTQGILDQRSAPLLCVNGVQDSIFPIEDHYLLLQHGNAKEARFFPGGHMGGSPEAEPLTIHWLAVKLKA